MAHRSVWLAPPGYGYRPGMPDDPLEDYLATLGAANRPQTPALGPGDLMDAIAQAINDAQWHDHQHRD
jgi:hypothetical protein